MEVPHGHGAHGARTFSRAPRRPGPRSRCPGLPALRSGTPHTLTLFSIHTHTRGRFARKRKSADSRVRTARKAQERLYITRRQNAIPARRLSYSETGPALHAAPRPRRRDSARRGDKTVPSRVGPVSWPVEHRWGRVVPRPHPSTMKEVDCTPTLTFGPRRRGFSSSSGNTSAAPASRSSLATSSWPAVCAQSSGRVDDSSCGSASAPEATAPRRLSEARLHSSLYDRSVIWPPALSALTRLCLGPISATSQPRLGRV